MDLVSIMVPSSSHVFEVSDFEASLSLLHLVWPWEIIVEVSGSEGWDHPFDGQVITFVPIMNGCIP